jgi:hypothetical protein
VRPRRAPWASPDHLANLICFILPGLQKKKPIAMARPIKNSDAVSRCGGGGMRSRVLYEVAPAGETLQGRSHTGRGNAQRGWPCESSRGNCSRNDLTPGEFVPSQNTGP